MPILFIHPRKGLYQITICKNCKYVFGCQNCSIKEQKPVSLVTYKSDQRKLQLACNHCQTFYNYPNQCPKCGQKEIISQYGGIDNLIVILSEKFDMQVTKIEVKTKINYYKKSDSSSKNQAYVTTRIYDPSIPYNIFEKIVFVHAENLLADLDYLTTENTMHALFNIISSVDSSTELIFDTADSRNPFFQKLAEMLNTNNDLGLWYSEFIENESENRNIFKFPPFSNILLLTSQEKCYEKSINSIQLARNYIKSFKDELNQVSIGYPYPARYLKRKGMYSYHIVVRYPRQYSDFFKLQKYINIVAQSYNLQVRLNPKNLF